MDGSQYAQYPYPGHLTAPPILHPAQARHLYGHPGQAGHHPPYLQQQGPSHPSQLQHLPSQQSPTQRQDLGGFPIALQEGMEDEAETNKRRRVQRACDVCRKKKIRCDGLQPGKQSCSHCASYGHQCTFVDAARKRAPPRSYIDALEARMEKMDQLLAELAPGVDFSDRIGKPVRLPDDKDKVEDVKPGLPQQQQLSEQQQQQGGDLSRGQGESDSSKSGSQTEIKQEEESDMDSEDEIALVSTRIALTNLGHRVSTLVTSDSSSSPGIRNIITADENSAKWRILDTTAAEEASEEGLSSCPRGPVEDAANNCVHFTDQQLTSVASALEESQQYLGKASSFHLIPLLQRVSGSAGDQEQQNKATEAFRPEVWQTPVDDTKWTIPEGVWPEPDLRELLIDAYFSRPHLEFPFINEAAFREEVEREELHTNFEWMGVALCLFAVGAKYVDDPRVSQLADGIPRATNLPGMRWFGASRSRGYNLALQGASLWYLQSVALSVIYLIGTPLATTSGWAFLGVLIRLLIDAGAHRKYTGRTLRRSRPVAEGWKRLWWTAYVIDRDFSSQLGRPMGIQDEDFDVDLPLEVDDAYLYLDDASATSIPKQPEGQPSIMSGFLANIKLNKIVGRTLRTIYAIGKARVTRGFVGPKWDNFIVTDIDSALNQWLDQVPEHLRYDPYMSDTDHFVQSSILHVSYYQTQILVHRPFIPGPKSDGKAALNFPSLAICTNAARSITHVLWRLRERDLHYSAGPTVIFRAFSSACVLLLIVWSSKKTGAHTSSSTMLDVRKCLDILGDLEEQWIVAGRFFDVLKMLIHTAELDVPAGAHPIRHEQGVKRSHDGESSPKETVSPLTAAAAAPKSSLGRGPRSATRDVSATSLRRKDQAKDARRAMNASNSSQTSQQTNATETTSSSSPQQQQQHQLQKTASGRHLPLSTEELVMAFSNTPRTASSSDSPSAMAGIHTPPTQNAASIASPPKSNNRQTTLFEQQFLQGLGVDPSFPAANQPGTYDDPLQRMLAAATGNNPSLNNIGQGLPDPMAGLYTDGGGVRGPNFPQGQHAGQPMVYDGGNMMGGGGYGGMTGGDQAPPENSYFAMGNTPHAPQAADPFEALLAQQELWGSQMWGTTPTPGAPPR